MEVVGASREPERELPDPDHSGDVEGREAEQGDRSDSDAYRQPPWLAHAPDGQHQDRHQQQDDDDARQFPEQSPANVIAVAAPGGVLRAGECIDDSDGERDGRDRTENRPIAAADPAAPTACPGRRRLVPARPVLIPNRLDALRFGGILAVSHGPKTAFVVP
ncbi:hypothetical protein [Bradyrhizobium diazoefficiens]